MGKFRQMFTKKDPQIPSQRRPLITEGTQARKAAEGHLEEAKSRGAEVRAVTESLHRMRVENGFVSRIEELITGGKDR